MNGGASMAITRRQFIKRTGMVTAAGLLGPSLFRHAFVSRALAETIGDRYLVVVFLDGGNDGLNTVVPYDNVGGLRVAYETARSAASSGGLRLAPTSLAVPSPPLPSQAFKDSNTGAQLGFHPALGGLRNLYELGKVAVVQGCGYPNYSLSHEESRLTWQTGQPGLTAGTGWVGRYLAANYTTSHSPAVCISDAVSKEFSQTATNVLAIDYLEGFGFPYDDYDDGDTAAKRDAFLALQTAAAGQAQATVQHATAQAMATLTSSESYPQLHAAYVGDRPSWNQAYEDLDNRFANPHFSWFGRNLRDVAKIIYGVAHGAPNVGARLFSVNTGGYDTHADQGAGDPTAQHYELLQGVGDALELFYQDTADMGLAEKICVMVYSEFSRRIMQNDNGTDHGSQGPMFVIGGGVNGGLYGNFPDILDPGLDADDADGNTRYSQAQGDGFRSTDFRDVYGTLLKHWLNMPAAQVAALLPADAGDPSTYWTVPNFDLGFL
jgi:uncharacterized protein (DUF1501 family)